MEAWMGKNVCITHEGRCYALHCDDGSETQAIDLIMEMVESHRCNLDWAGAAKLSCLLAHQAAHDFSEVMKQAG